MRSWIRLLERCECWHQPGRSHELVVLWLVGSGRVRTSPITPHSLFNGLIVCLIWTLTIWALWVVNLTFWLLMSQSNSAGTVWYIPVVWPVKLKKGLKWNNHLQMWKSSSFYYSINRNHKQKHGRNLGKSERGSCRRTSVLLLMCTFIYWQRMWLITT